MKSLLRFLVNISICTLAIFALISVAMICFVFWTASMPGTAVPSSQHATNLPLVTSLKQHVSALSVVRNVTEVAALDRAAEYIETTLTAMGYQVQSQWFETRGVRVRNLAVVIPAASRSPVVVVGAHYDSAHDTPGADDNASGVAGLLEIARAMRSIQQASRRHELHLVFFVNEEPPFFRTQQMGSYRYAEALSRNNRAVEAMFSLEMLGYFCDEPGCQHYPFPMSIAFPDKGNFIAFVGNLDSRALTRRVVKSFRTHAAIASEGVSAPAFIPGIDFSDQLWFWHFGFPAVMVTDTSFMRYAHYHKPTDTPEKLDYTRMGMVVEALGHVIHEMYM